jgi:hypothetical protein
MKNKLYIKENVHDFSKITLARQGGECVRSPASASRQQALHVYGSHAAGGRYLHPRKDIVVPVCFSWLASPLSFDESLFYLGECLFFYFILWVFKIE